MDIRTPVVVQGGNSLFWAVESGCAHLKKVHNLVHGGYKSILRDKFNLNMGQTNRMSCRMLVNRQSCYDLVNTKPGSPYDTCLFRMPRLLAHIFLDLRFLWVKIFPTCWNWNANSILFSIYCLFRLKAVERLHVIPSSHHQFKDTCWVYCLLVFLH